MGVNVSKIFQPKYIFDMLGIKDTQEAEKVMSTLMYMLIYLQEGDKIQTTVATFEKISPDLLHIDCSLNGEFIVDELHKKKIIRLPV